MAVADPETMGLRVIFAPIEGITDAALFPQGKPFLFQAPPLEEFKESHAYNHDDYATAFGGQLSRPSGRQLVEVSFDTLWIDDGSSNHAPGWALVKKALNPILAKEQLIKILRAGTPFWLLAHQMPVWQRYDIRMQVTLRALTSQEKAGEEDSRYFSVQLREWRDGSTQTRTHGTAPPSTKVGAKGRVLVVSALRADEDTLAEIAKKYYGSVTYWRAISKRNGLSIGPNENLKTHYAKVPRGEYAKILLPPPSKPQATKLKAKK